MADTWTERQRSRPATRSTILNPDNEIGEWTQPVALFTLYKPNNFHFILNRLRWTSGNLQIQQ